ncbi:MAG: cytidylate kinase family protein [archaeon]
MIITLGGQMGSGKSTVAEILAKQLHYKRYSMGELRRKMALARGMTLEEFNKLGEKESFTDKDVDEYQKELGEKEDDFIVDGRLSFFFIPLSFKVFLTVDPDVGAARLLGRPKKEEQYATVEEAKAALERRMKSDKKRYFMYYGVDCYDPKQFDLAIDTTHLAPERVAKEILDRLP